MKSIATARDLEDVRSLPRAFVFVYVNWATQARHSEAAFHDFVTAWALAEPGLPIPVYHVDLSNQDGEIWEAIRKWLREEGHPFDPLTYGGCGALVWVRLGSVVATVPYVAVVERPKLIAVTKRIFESSGEPAEHG